MRSASQLFPDPEFPITSVLVRFMQSKFVKVFPPDFKVRAPANLSDRAKSAFFRYSNRGPIFNRA